MDLIRGIASLVGYSRGSRVCTRVVDVEHAFSAGAIVTSGSERDSGGNLVVIFSHAVHDTNRMGLVVSMGIACS